MRHHRLTSFVTAVIALGVCVAAASAQIPKMTSAYELVDVGPVAVPGTCSCIANPFTVTYRPDPRYGSGPAAPDEATTVALTDRAAAERRIAKERPSLVNRAEDGLSGNPHASLSVAIDLSLEASIAAANPKGEQEVVRWLYLAASQEHPDAFRLLGHRYARGNGVQQDHAAAAYWFHRGASRGDAISMVALGLLYAAGRGVPQDWSAAARWWERAQSRAPLASRFAGDAYACGLGVTQDHARAVAAYKAAAERGESSSSTQLGHMYSRGCAETPDDAAAVKAYERAAEEGSPEAQIALSELIRQGRGADANPYRAYTWARLAELRLPAGALKDLAAERVKAAVRLMNPQAIPAQEAMVQDMVARAAKPLR
jgi:TPR repeat protein